MLAVSQSSSFSGPIPPPEAFSKYPKDVQRAIIEMAQVEQAHRHEMDKSVAKGIFSFRRWGQAAAFFLSSAIIALAAYALALGHAKTAAVIIVSGLVPTAGLIAMSRSRDDKKKAIDKPDDEKQQQLPFPKPDTER